MNINGVIVCVDYADHLAHGLASWRHGLDSLVVVTVPRDRQTLTLCGDHGVAVHETDVFYRPGAVFNKSGAIDEALAAHPSHDWTLLIDADVAPPSDWRSIVEAADPQCGTLYGAKRANPDDTPIHDHELAGFFTLFHSKDQAAQNPLGHWHNAGSYDSAFSRRWPRERQAILPLTLVHHGDSPGANWCGRGNHAGLLEMRMNRVKRGGWRHEQLTEQPNER
jgi:hypothetical protein